MDRRKGLGKYKLELLVWLPTQNKWVRTYAKNEYTEMMWEQMIIG